MTAQMAMQPVEDERSAKSFAFSPDLFLVGDPTSPRSETIRGMRTHLLAQHVNEGRRGLAVCAASGDAWTMTIAANLAVAFAQVGLSCLLVDADLRSPRLNQIITAPGAIVGLADCLSQNVAVEQAIYQDVLPNLSVIYSGGPRSDAQELLGSEEFGRLAKNWLRDYDITIINTPAANKYADGRRISAIVGYSVVVARQNVSYVSDLRHLIDQLRGDGVKIVGTILSYE